ncbi:pilus assembly protein N-terminal domain-containing protein [Photobacterium sp. SDRW27]|uniref:type II and III secretion system protein family protein n=1 Tax=Photobacterium obscurum TaxID=2829490 RepID=UPI00224389AE|nr:pilus assembly protein N-terminal domain-containing protein [Photobacterium obscurum]MCW8327416.1 pilus assembly protein N-terminal domain-containing protein [Photobacterium obscurum]
MADCRLFILITNSRSRFFATVRLLLLAALALVTSSSAIASSRYIPVNTATSIDFKQDIGTVFISQPEIADYKIINKRTLVLFSKNIGQAQLIVYASDHNQLLSQLVHVDINLADIRRQLKLYYPDLGITITSVGDKVAVRGKVYSEKQRDDIYRLVANLLGREKVTRYGEAEDLRIKNGDNEFEEMQWVNFHRNYIWDGIIEGLELDRVDQINVKISVAQVSKEFNETLGVDWSSIGQAAGTFSFQQFNASDLSTVISAIGNDSLAEVLAEPNLTVMSGESASFLVGGEVPVIVTNQNTTNISFKEFGVKLNLSAKVENDDNIRLQIAPEVSAIEKTIKAAGIEVPQLSTRRALTTVKLADGESFMLGGLMSSDDFEQISRIPLLGDIPVLGAAFRKASTKRMKTELIIIATVNLVKPVSAQEVRLPVIHKTSTLSRLFNIYGKKSTQNQKVADTLTIDILDRGGFIQ